MSITPGQVWERLSPERQEQIIDEFMTLTFPVILLVERSLTIPLSQSPIFSLFIVIKLSLLTTKAGLKPLFFGRFKT